MTVSHPSNRNGKSPLDADRPMHAKPRHAQADALLDEWVARLEQPATRAQGLPISAKSLPSPAPRTEGTDFDGQRAASVREAFARVTREGGTFHFADEAGGELVLARVRERTIHRGTVALRGPRGLPFQAFQEHGLTENQARAAEFVAAWFGAPFDAASAARGRAHVPLEWGLWPLPRPEIPRVLSAWKSRAPERFASMVGAYGIDVVARDDLRGAALLVVDPRGAILRGERALDLVASDATRLAILARAGRDPHAQAAQIERGVATTVMPVLRTSVRRGETRTSLAEVVASARGIAALLCAARRLDVTAIEEIARVTITDAPPEISEEAVLDAVGRYLRVSGHAAAAHDMRRTLSSPELDH